MRTSRQARVVPVLRGFDRLDVLDDLAEPVLITGAAGLPASRPETRARRPPADVVHAGEAKRMRHDFRARVIAAYSRSGTVRKCAGRDALGQLGGICVWETKSGSVGEALLDFLGDDRAVRQTRKLPSPRCTSPDCPDRFHRRAYGERLAVSIEDAARFAGISMTRL